MRCCEIQGSILCKILSLYPDFLIIFNVVSLHISIHTCQYPCGIILNIKYKTEKLNYLLHITLRSLLRNYGAQFNTRELSNLVKSI